LIPFLKKHTKDSLLGNIKVGVITTLPIILGVWLIFWVFNTASLGIKWLFNITNDINLTFWTIIFLFLFFYLLGGLINRKGTFKLYDYIESKIYKITIIGSIVKSVKDLIKSFTNESSYLGVVKLKHAGVTVLGFITKELENEEYIIFIPTSPNPTSGFIVFEKKSNFEMQDLTVEEAFQIIVSLGASYETPKKN
jgi:uncharacterized membrane protein